MPPAPVPAPKPVRVVTADTLMVAPAVLGRPLAAPGQRLAGMAIDLVVIGALSWLAKPCLGLATGAMLLVLLGNGAHVPTGQRVLRWICRIGGAAMIILAVLNLAQSSSLLSGKLHLDAIDTEEVAAAPLRSVIVPPTATSAELRAANRELAEQVEMLRDENKKLRAAPHSLVGRTQATIRAMGVTFGWAGVYFTLFAGLTNGRTLGKLLVRTRVVKINGTPLKFFDAFIRQGGYVAGVAMGLIGFLKLLWEPNRQAVEDRIASTVVVKI